MKLEKASVAIGSTLVAALVLLGHAGPALAADGGWAPLAFSDDPEAAWAEHSIEDYYVATTTVKSSTISLGEVPTPKLLIHTDVPTADIGCTALYVGSESTFRKPPFLKRFSPFSTTAGQQNDTVIRADQWLLPRCPDTLN